MSKMEEMIMKKINKQVLKEKAMFWAFWAILSVVHITIVIMLFTDYKNE